MLAAKRLTLEVNCSDVGSPSAVSFFFPFLFFFGLKKRAEKTKRGRKQSKRASGPVPCEAGISAAGKWDRSRERSLGGGGRGAAGCAAPVPPAAERSEQLQRCKFAENMKSIGFPPRLVINAVLGRRGDRVAFNP